MFLACLQCPVKAGPVEESGARHMHAAYAAPPALLPSTCRLTFWLPGRQGEPAVVIHGRKGVARLEAWLPALTLPPLPLQREQEGGMRVSRRCGTCSVLFTTPGGEQYNQSETHLAAQRAASRRTYLAG